MALPTPLHAQTETDSDHDGLSDRLEQTLLRQFAPRFMIDPSDCSRLPAAFTPNLTTPRVEAEDNTVYGQVFPAATSAAELPAVEIRFYHLWKQDCGAHGHLLDTEHVSVLVRASVEDREAADWKAVYWYAAAHENTVCDVSQITRAATLGAEDHGATVWISPGKHASFLNEALCHRGCGNDLCGVMKPVPIHRLINLGEPGKPMNGSLWIAAAAWPLAARMTGTDFPTPALLRLNGLPDTDIAWFRPGRHPAQGVIAISSSTAGTLGRTGDTASNAVSGAVSSASDSTGSALEKSYRSTVHSLGTSARHIGDFLHR